MSCSRCASSFGLFNKEHGCKQCRFSFCSKCLSGKIALPKLDNERHRVCFGCHKKLSGESEPVKVVPLSPPKVHVKRFNAITSEESISSKKATDLSNPIKSTTNMDARTKHEYSGMSKEDIEIAQRLHKLREQKTHEKTNNQSESSGMSKEDIEIAHRLRKLREGNSPEEPPSQQELEERLALLKGENPDSLKHQNKYSLSRPNNKTEFEETQDLLAEICAEVEIDSRAFPESENEVKTVENVNDDHNASMEGGDIQLKKETSLDEVQQLMQQTAKEAQLDAEKAIKDLQKDKELWDMVKELKGSQDDLSSSDSSSVSSSSSHLSDP